MPELLAEAPSPVGAATLERKRWTRGQCEALRAAGLLDYENYELLDGELVSVTPNRPKHNNPQMALYDFLTAAFGPGRAATEASIEVSAQDTPSWEPQPDVLVLTTPRRVLGLAPRRPEHIELVAEVSDSTLAYDLADKAALYARAGLREYWVLDVNGRRLIVHREPELGRYRKVAEYAADEAVAPLGCPSVGIRVGDLL